MTLNKKGYFYWKNAPFPNSSQIPQNPGVKVELWVLVPPVFGHSQGGYRDL